MSLKAILLGAGKMFDMHNTVRIIPRKPGVSLRHSEPLDFSLTQEDRMALESDWSQIGLDLRESIKSFETQNRHLLKTVNR